MVGKMSTGERLFQIFNVILMISLMVITMYPLYHVAVASISDPVLLLKHEGPMWSVIGKATLDGYKITFANPNILVGFKNTLFYVFVGTSINLLLTTFAAYVLSRSYFYLRNLLMKLMVITMFFSGGLIPLFFVVRNLELYDTGWSILLPYAISTFNVIMMRTFFLTIPASLEEAALIDGANDFQIYARIILPLSKPVIAVIALYYGVGHWNAWFSALVFIRDRELYPIQMFLREILILNSSLSTGEGISDLMEESLSKELVKYCAIIVSTIPILFLYPFLQKYFVKGVLIGAIKG